MSVTWRWAQLLSRSANGTFHAHRRSQRPTLLLKLVAHDTSTLTWYHVCLGVIYFLYTCCFIVGIFLSSRLILGLPPPPVQSYEKKKWQPTTPSYINVHLFFYMYTTVIYTMQFLMNLPFSLHLIIRSGCSCRNMTYLLKKENGSLIQFEQVRSFSFFHHLLHVNHMDNTWNGLTFNNNSLTFNTSCYSISHSIFKISRIWKYVHMQYSISCYFEIVLHSTMLHALSKLPHI